MKIVELNWMQLENYLEGDDRIVLPLGSVEQHGYLSLGVDMILAERVAVEAAEPLGIPVLPALPYGLAPYFAAFPGSPTLGSETYGLLLQELLGSLLAQGFRRIALVNGHGGNNGGRPAVEAWQADHPDAQVLWHNWWGAPRTRAVVEAIDREATHASWLENFPWTRLAGVAPPDVRKPMIDASALQENPMTVRAMLGDGSLGGLYERADEDMFRLWAAGVEETRALLESGWR